MGDENKNPESTPLPTPVERPMANNSPYPGLTPLAPPQQSQTLSEIGGESPTPYEPENVLVSIGNSFKSFMGGVFSWVIFPVIIVLILHNFVFQAYHVLGSSMVETLHETDYLIISKVGYTEALVERMLGRNKPYIPARGQIVVFHYPNDPSKVFVKRVVGVPGDRVVIKNGSVTIFNKENPNGFNPDKAYELDTAVTKIDTDETIEDGFIFVIGDNRNPGASYDSREWGQLKSTYIIGNAVLRLLPLDKIKIL
jgi:signal peptidase I